MKFTFCPKCGAKLIDKYSYDEGGVPYCPVDDIMYFETPKPCIIVAVLKDNEVLLLKQSYIFKNSKVLISGYVTNGENIEETVYREVEEETGISICNIKYLGSEYLSSKEIIMITFMAEYLDGEIIKSEEVEGAEWIKIDNALDQMKEDEIGKRIIKKIINQLNSDNI